MSSIRHRYYRLRRRSAKSDDGEFLWLISLSDLMMLLFVFFVVLFSFASKKLNATDYLQIRQIFSNQASQIENPLDETQKKLLKWVIDRKLLDSVDVVRKQDALILEIKEKLLFNVGEADLKTDSKDILPALKEALGKIPAPYRIGIEGHTDDTPVHGSDNWRLSVERALRVREAMHLTPDLESRTVIMGFGDTRPLLPNKDASGNSIKENQAKNRRVTIRLF